MFLPSWATLKAYTPVGVLYQDYSGDDDLKLVITDQCNGGFFDCTFQLCNYKNRLPGYGYVIEVRDTVRDVCMFRGLAQRPEVDAGNIATINAIGHGNPEGTCTWKRDWGDGNQIEANGVQKWAAGTPMLNLWQDTLSMCQQIFSGTLSDLGGIQLTQDTKDYQGQSPYDIWQEIISWTAGFSTPLLWFVRGNNTPQLFTRTLDLGNRYRCTFDNDTVKVKDSYDMSSAVNGAVVRYGNGKLRRSPSVGTRDHTVLPANNDRDKFLDMNNDIRGDGDAQDLADHAASRFNTLRPINGEIVLCGAKIQAEPPIVVSVDYNYPVHLIQSGWYIYVEDLPIGQAPFDVATHFIVAARYEFDADRMTLTTGELINLGSTIREVSSFMTSRAAMANFQSVLNVPQVNQDTTPYYGPQSDGALPAQNDAQPGIPVFTLNDQFTLESASNPLLLPSKAGISPTVIPDYGVQANFGREADSIGIKGFVKVIPCKVLNWSIDFTAPPASDTIPTDSITIQFYETYPFTVGVDTPFATKSVSAAPGNSDEFSVGEQITFSNGGKIGIRVSVAAATANCGFQVGVQGRKLYPDLGITS